MKVALTGHRPQRLGLPEDVNDPQWDQIENWFINQLIKMQEAAVLSGEDLILYCGMASGCDISFGLTAAVMKTTFENVRLCCVLPCKNYNSSCMYYDDLHNLADEWIELSDEFYKGCDNVRDQYMVDHCDVLLAVWDGNESGGVWSTIRKAQKKGIDIIYCPEVKND